MGVGVGVGFEVSEAPVRLCGSLSLPHSFSNKYCMPDSILGLCTQQM